MTALLEAWNLIAIGQVKHDQEKWFCQTGQCLFGWAALIECRDAGLDRHYQRVSMGVVTYAAFNRDLAKALGLGGGILNANSFAQARYGLALSDCKVLFAGAAKIQDQYDVIKRVYGNKALPPGSVACSDYGACVPFGTVAENKKTKVNA